MAQKALLRRPFNQADEGTRTLDLLHGKEYVRTLKRAVLPANRNIPLRRPVEAIPEDSARFPWVLRPISDRDAEPGAP